ncbi:DUF4157 domain-containing protein [Flavobacteriaceae bacterium]|nr:DUF4157 domain-containing protein [Flavobacteriaceae bacterium]
MNSHAEKSQENKSQSVENKSSESQSGAASTFQFVDNRTEALGEKKLQAIADDSPQVSQLKTFQHIANNSHQVAQTLQLQKMADNHNAQYQQPIQKKENNTGLPDDLKSGIENLSGHSMDDVKVNYNSDKPAQLQAHAYAQGTDIHLGPGQEKHLPHEAWHVVQQKQNRVKPTMQMKGKVNVNDDPKLEKEADIMGAKANSSLSLDIGNNTINQSSINSDFKAVQRVTSAADKEKAWKKDKATLIGRIQKLKDSEALLSAYTQFVDTLHSDPGNDQQATVDNIMRILKNMNAMQVPYHWYLDNQGADNFEQLRQEKAISSTKNGRLWSKLNVRRSKKAADETGGVFLESSVGGTILNGLLFGFGWGESSAMDNIWNKLSATYVQGLSEKVEADVLEGIDPTSVLSTTEIDNLFNLIEAGSVEKIVVNIYKMINNKFVKIDTIDVQERATWDAIERVPSDEVASDEAPSQISDLPWKERQRMIDKTERLFDELEDKLKDYKKDIDNGEVILESP